MNAKAEQIALVMALVAYWERHPMASDSVDGIHRWWLGAPPVALAVLTDVLQWMKEQRVIEEVSVAGGHRHYRRCGGTERWREFSQQPLLSADRP